MSTRPQRARGKSPPGLSCWPSQLWAVWSGTCAGSGCVRRRVRRKARAGGSASPLGGPARPRNCAAS
eukprot:5450106-Alexandrium_andersonii.AAC.1